MNERSKIIKGLLGDIVDSLDRLNQNLIPISANFIGKQLEAEMGYNKPEIMKKDATPEFKYAETENEPVKKSSGLDFEKKYKIAGNPCNKCGGLFSWDLRPDRKFPLHVDSNGKIENNGRNGDCPKSSF